jgi:antitoxin component YwqK of YwqJK toxin-antitoxin module
VITKTTHHPGSRRQKKSETMYLAATTVQQSADEYWNCRLARYTAEGKDLKHGTSKAWYSNSTHQLDGFYQMDKRSGTFTYWHENGQVAATGEYKDDRAEGIWVWWHPNGQKSAVGKYESGTLMGEWRWWNEEGRLTKQHTYDGSESISSQDEESYDVGERPEDDETTVR